MAARRSGAYFLLFLGFAAALAAAVLDYRVAFYLKAISAYFAYGRSFFQLYFFLSWGTLCFLCLWLVQGRERCFLGATAIALVLALHALNVLVFSRFTADYGLTLADHVYAAAGGRFSVSSLGHTHVMKPVMIMAAELAGFSGPIRSGDNGYPYYVLLDHAWFAAGLMLLLLTAVVLVAALIARARLWRAWERSGLALAYTVCSFEVLKSALDGGPLNPVTAACMGALAGLLAYRPEREGADEYLFPIFLVRYAVPFLLPAAAAAVWLPTIDRSNEELLGGTISDVALLYGFLALLILSSNFLARRRIPLLAPVLLLAASLWTFRNSNAWYRDEFLPLRVTLPAGAEILLLTADGCPTGSDARCDGDLALRREVLSQPSTVLDFYRRYKLRPGVREHAVVGTTCLPEQETSASAELRVVSGVLPTGEQRSPLFDSFFVAACSPGEWCTHRISARLVGCLPISKGIQTAVANRLSLLGAESFIYRVERIWNDRI